jgi:DNA-binding CsgD family transcriptional regulator
MDLVWLDGEKPLVSFEIDSNFYVSSIWKLLDINADLRFWIYYGDMTEDELFNFRAKNKDKLITLVKLPVFFYIHPEEDKKIQNHFNRHHLYDKNKPKKPSPQNQLTSIRITYGLLQMDLSIDEIAKQRGLTESTITRHIEDLIRMDYPINIDKFVSKEKLENIINASKKLNTEKLSELKQFFGDSYSYDDIRITIASCYNKGKVIKKTSYTLDDVRQEYHNAYIYWTPEDDEKLKELFLSKKTLKEIAKILQRKVGAIDARLKRNHINRYV